MRLGPANPRWPPSGGVLPAPNNERKGLNHTLPTVFPLSEEEQRHCTSSKTARGRMCQDLTFPQLGGFWPGTGNIEDLHRLFAQFSTRFSDPGRDAGALCFVYVPFPVSLVHKPHTSQQNLVHLAVFSFLVWVARVAMRIYKSGWEWYLLPSQE